MKLGSYVLGHKKTFDFLDFFLARRAVFDLFRRKPKRANTGLEIGVGKFDILGKNVCTRARVTHNIIAKIFCSFTNVVT